MEEERGKSQTREEMPRKEGHQEEKVKRSGDNGCNKLKRSHSPFSASSAILMVPILTGVQRDLTVVLICICLMVNAIEIFFHVFSCLYICSLNKYLLKSFGLPVLLFCFVFILKYFLCSFYILWKCHIYKCILDINSAKCIVDKSLFSFCRFDHSIQSKKLKSEHQRDSRNPCLLLYCSQQLRYGFALGNV